MGTSTLLLAEAKSTIDASCCYWEETATQLACFVAVAGATAFSTNCNLFITYMKLLQNFVYHIILG